MTRDEAITTTAHWWASMMIAQVWDNGDRDSERIHAMFRATQPVPTPGDRLALDAALSAALASFDWMPEDRYIWYCDYAATWLDDILQTVNPQWNSRFCGPQKAGTRITVDAAGAVSVEAKHGYGKPWVPLAPLSQTENAR